ncbi:MAG: hypothetical protein GX102_11535 [Porphyromonadaceae bacterium]|jgi:hypothetical protein|nr:hypothetical protein [Porphyromonadaceae bacterium]
MKKLNQYIFKRKAKKFLQHSTREKRWVDYKSAKTILLLFESDYIEKNRFIRRIIDELNQDGKKVVAWGFLDKKITSTAILPTFRILDRSTIDWFECPKEYCLRELAEVEFDLLIDLTLKDILPLQYVCLYAKAGTKAGMSRSMDDIIDFKIIIPEPDPDELTTGNDENHIEFKDLNETLFHTDQQFLYEQILHYIKNIQTSDK